MKEAFAYKTVAALPLDSACHGCAACESVCPVGAISLGWNQHGFWTPQIDPTACVHCGRCVAVCQMEEKPLGRLSMAQFAVVNRAEGVRDRAASGGLFGAIGETLMAQNPGEFRCFGAMWGEDLNVLHGEADTWRSFTGSKYVQSDLRGIYRRIAQLLKEGKTVLFTGTGCQCAGLRRYVEQCKVDDDRLFVVDIICHGVPSPKLWEDYRRALEAEQGQPVVGYTFRHKADGWRGLHPKAWLADGTEAKKTKLLESYGAMFGNLSLNEICYHCPYATQERVGDLTMGDYWGIEKSDCPLDDGHGVSLCLVNTQKGQALFEQCRAALDVYEIHDDSYLQPRLLGAVGKNILCDDFRQDLQKLGYVKTARKYTGHGKAYRAMMKLGAFLRQKGRGRL